MFFPFGANWSFFPGQTLFSISKLQGVSVFLALSSMFFLETQGRFQVPKKAFREGFSPSEVLAATLGSPSAGLRYHGSDLSTKLKLLGVTWCFRVWWFVFKYLFMFTPKTGEMIRFHEHIFLELLGTSVNRWCLEGSDERSWEYRKSLHNGERWTELPQISEAHLNHLVSSFSEVAQVLRSQFEV